MKNSAKKLLINFGPLKKGGGQNVALNFVQALFRRSSKLYDFYFIVTKGSLIDDFLSTEVEKRKILYVSSNPLIRTLQELTIGTIFLKKNEIQNVYTYFGFGLFLGKVKQIIGSADSNLYFPEIDFWVAESRLEKIKRYIVDQYRKFGLKKASGVIYENKSMYDRADKLYPIESKSLILPSFDEPLIRDEISVELDKESFKILMLCGWQRNKNILLIPEIARVLVDLGLDFQFIITVKDDSSICAREFFQLVDKHSVHEFIQCIGPVTKSQLPDLYKKIDVVLLLSRLESFSNNIIESWYYKKPLIISDEIWSRAICGDAAKYVPRDDSKIIAQSIVELANDHEYIKNLVKLGEEAFSVFPDIDERLEQELNFIEEFYD